MHTQPDSWPDDWSAKRYFVTLFGILVFACALRWVGLGRWSFASDELGTFHEVQAFVQPPSTADNDPDSNVPKMIPVGMLVHHLGHQLFGRDEAGARSMMAVCGMLQIVVLGLGLPPFIGRFNTHLVCLLMAVTPEHLFYSQYHRFYAPAALMVTGACVCGLYAVTRQSLGWLAGAVVCTWLAVLTQTLTGSIVGALVLAMFVGRPVMWTKTDLRLVGAAFVNAVASALFSIVYLYPLGKGKAIGYRWVGDTIPQAVLSGVTQLSFPVALLAVPGVCILWQQQRAVCRYLGIFALAWAGSMVVLPKLIPFHSAYLFPLNGPCFIFAGIAIGQATQRLMLSYRVAGVVLSGSLVFMNLPSLVSYYQDGNRHQFERAAARLMELRQASDRVAIVQGDKFEYYQPTLKGQWERLPPLDFEAWADARRPINGKLWIVVPGGRSGVPAPWAEWLQRRGRLRATVTQRHFDYHEYPVLFFTLESPD